VLDVGGFVHAHSMPRSFNTDTNTNSLHPTIKLPLESKKPNEKKQVLQITI
jgi:hypothetical protein